MDQNKIGFGFVIRDDNGRPVAASSWGGEGAPAILEAEAMALLWGL